MQCHSCSMPLIEGFAQSTGKHSQHKPFYRSQKKEGYENSDAANTTKPPSTNGYSCDTQKKQSCMYTAQGILQCGAAGTPGAPNQNGFGFMERK